MQLAIAICDYKLYEKFYQLQESSMEERINALVEPRAEKAATTAAKFASGLAVMLANKAADDARQSLKKIKEEEDNIAQNVINKASTEVTKSVNDLIKDKSVEMNLNISSTSVTILGIFAGIVLTIVAGLFYSSSVLESVSSANFYKLLAIASLVGLVCFHLVIVMFRYIERISGKTQNHYFLNKTSIVITVLLIIIMLGGFILQFVFPESPSMNADSSNIHINATVDMPNNDDTNAIPNETTNDNSNAGQPLPDETEGESSEPVITDTSN